MWIFKRKYNDDMKEFDLLAKEFVNLPLIDMSWFEETRNKPVNLYEANLTKANLTGADLVVANLYKANIKGGK